jgi:dihydrolipoamide dehydrogenase
LKSENFDVCVIGAGPGGYVAAIRAGQLGMKVALVEKNQLGGVCLNVGCIPTKALLKSAEVLRSAQKAKRYGVLVPEAGVDFSAVIKRSRQVAESLSRGVAFLMKKNGVEVASARGKLLGEQRVGLSSGETISARQIILATGARPRPLPGIPFDQQKIITAKEAMSLTEIPEKLVIVGAGAIGVEFADFYAAMGSRVSLVEMLPRLLPVEDREVSMELGRIFKRKRIKTYLETRVEGLDASGETVKITISQAGEANRELTADKVLVAIGVQANSEDLGLETAGVELEKGWIKTNAYLQTSAPGIYAIGDVAGPPWLAHVASHEGITAVEHLAGLDVNPMTYDNIPGCTYCSPQIASVGLTEEAARAAGHELKIGKFPYKASGKAMAAGETDGFTKLIFDARYGELLGAHIIGAEATELIAELGLARKLEATHTALLETIHAHPTLSETLMEAAGLALDKGIHF